MCDFTLLSGFGSSSTVLFGFVSSPARSYEQNSWFGSVSELWGQGLQGCDAKKCQEPKTAINAESIHIQNTSIQKKTVCWLPSGWNGFSICLLEREYNAFFFFYFQGSNCHSRHSRHSHTEIYKTLCCFVLCVALTVLNRPRAAKAECRFKQLGIVCYACYVQNQVLT